MQKTKLFPILILTLLLPGCFSGPTQYEGLSFPETANSEVTFLEQTIPANCSAFAHLLLNTKVHSTGQDIANAMHQEAQAKGANLILVGMTREMADEELEANHFEYYGPTYAYTFSKTWLGWKFGFDEWNDAGSLIGLGANNWGSTDVSLDNSLLIQAVFLRCEETR